jgi:glycosyltransferase involved in cell wall biosynthesis
VAQAGIILNMDNASSPIVLPLSVIIITKNEARHIAACLQSVSFASEIIVFDSGSTDGTIEIARQHGAVVHQSTDWPGFGPQKNRALEVATQIWVLSIDADERVTPELKQEIIETLAAPVCEGYFMPRLSELCGQPIRHSGWWPDYVLRLFRREAGCFSDVPVHERVELNGTTAKLHACLLHYPYETLEALIQKMNRYSSDAAHMMFAKGKRAGVLSIVGHSVWTFVRIYLFRRGFLDGRYGFVLAATAAAGSFFRYSKLMMLCRTNSQSTNEVDRTNSSSRLK